MLIDVSPGPGQLRYLFAPRLRYLSSPLVEAILRFPRDAPRSSSLKLS